MLQELVCQLFSSECGLTSLRLDIACNDSYVDLHQCLKPCNNLSSDPIFNQYQTPCLTLRRLQIHLEYTCFLEHLIEHIPFLEKLHVHFRNSLEFRPRSKIEVETLIQSNGNWSNKVRQKNY
jgi:hypothetical protein